MDPTLLDALLSVAHFLMLFVMVGALSGELFVLRLAPSPATLQLLARMDAFYGGSAVLLIVAGVCRVLYGLKESSYYMGSHAFWGKIGVFIIIGLISILPTMRFMQWRRAVAADAAFLPPEAQWKGARTLAMVQAHLLILVVIFAALMARGIG